MNNLFIRILEKYSFSGENGFDIENPATQENIFRLENTNSDLVRESIEKSSQAQQKFKKLLSLEKASLLTKWYELIIKNTDSLAEIISLENGKPFEEAKGEVLYSAKFVLWYAEKAKRIDSRIFDPNIIDTEGRVDYQPVGVVAAITPWNFPLAMITRKVAPAIAAGCSVVLKPSELTPLAAIAAKELFVDAGGDPDLFQVVYGDPVIIGKAFQESKSVRKITFTGSTKVGKLLMQQAADSVKKVSLELGGNAPFIVFENADIDKAIEGLIGSKIRNAGQVCIAPNRIFVHESVKIEFVDKLKEVVSKLKQGNGFDDGVDFGPLINTAAVDKVQAHVDDAIKKGAKLVLGGKINDQLQGRFFEATILDDMQDDMIASCEETFGPVMAIYSFSSEQEVIDRANNTNYGLASYFYSNDMNQIRRVRNALEYGMVGVNCSAISNEKAPFGGVKESGLGREGSDEGIYEFLEAKYSIQSFI